MGLSGLDGSVRQNTSANPSDASRRCGASVPVILREMLWLTTCTKTCVIKAGRSSWVNTVNAEAALSSSSRLEVGLARSAVKLYVGIGLRASAMALAYLIAFNALSASR